MILAIDGSYRDDGFTDKVVVKLKEEIESLGEKVEIVNLRDYPIEFCLNCRECTQEPGDMPGECVQKDGMGNLISKIENADGYILASPTNFNSVTAVFKRFMERLVVYAYWPWGSHAPTFRKAKSKKKKSILVTSSAAPAILARIAYGTLGQLKTASKTIGAEPVGIICAGMVSKNREPNLSENIIRKIKTKSSDLVNHIKNV